MRPALITVFKSARSEIEVGGLSHADFGEIRFKAGEIVTSLCLDTDELQRLADLVTRLRARVLADHERVTKAEERLLSVCKRDGEAWFVPAQTNMVRRLIRRGLLSCIPKVTRYNPLRGLTERRVTPSRKAEGV